jgi:hypothetical protein
VNNALRLARGNWRGVEDCQGFEVMPEQDNHFVNGQAVAFLAYALAKGVVRHAIQEFEHQIEIVSLPASSMLEEINVLDNVTVFRPVASGYLAKHLGFRDEAPSGTFRISPMGRTELLDCNYLTITDPTRLENLAKSAFANPLKKFIVGDRGMPNHLPVDLAKFGCRFLERLIASRSVERQAVPEESPGMAQNLEAL